MAAIGPLSFTFLQAGRVTSIIHVLIGAITPAPEIELNERKIFWPRGKVLGGSSAINGMIYIRGVPLDFAACEQAGAKGWSWEEVLPYYKKQRLSKPIKMIYMEMMAPCMSRTLETKGLSMTFT